MSFIPGVSPNFEAPLHMAPYVDVLERASAGGVRAVVSAPPQHGKTVTTLHAIVLFMLANPDKRHVYITYGQSRADRVQGQARSIARRAELPLGGTKRYWTLPEGGSMIWTSFGGALGGEPIDGVMFIDDPYKDRRHAESKVYRDFLRDSIDDVMDARLHRSASCVLMSTRWVPDDLSGFLMRRGGWERVNLKALADGRDQHPLDTRTPGEPLWPERKTAAELEAKRARNAYSFASLYQGEPRPRGGKLFKRPHYYDQLPQGVAYQTGYGVDLAYTEDTRSDWSVCLRLRRVMRDDGKSLYYVVKMWKEQMEAPEFARILKNAAREYHGDMFFYASGVERGAASFIQRQKVNLQVMDTGRRDKFTRALDTAEIWNEGRILLPGRADDVPEDNEDDWGYDDEMDDWVAELRNQVGDFTGVGNEEDDIVDALVSAIDGMESTEFDNGQDDDDYGQALPALRM